MTPIPASKRGRNLTTIRIAAVAGMLAVIGFSGLLIAQSQAQNATVSATNEAVTVAETTTVAAGTLTTTLDAVGSLEPVQQTTLSFSATAPITNVFVEIGNRVAAGTVLATLDTTDGEAKVRQAQLSLAQQQAALNELISPATENEIALAELQVQSAQAGLYSASSSSTTSAEDIEIARLQTELAANSLWQSQINRDQRLEQEAARNGGTVDWGTEQEINASVNSAENNVAVSEIQYEDTANGTTSYSQLASGQQSLASAQAKLDALLAGASESDIRLAQINVEQAQLDVDAAMQSLSNYALTAPFDGLVADMDLIPGVLSTTGALTLIDNSVFTLDVSIAEADMPNIAVGQDVTLAVQALPDAALTGAITRLGVAPSSSGGLVTYNATITLDPAPNVTLRPGMSATASIILEQLNNVILVPTRFLSTNAATGATTVMVETEPGVYTETPVTVGGRDATHTEITSGLSAGQTIVLIAQDSDSAAAAAGGLGLLGGLTGGGGPPAGFSPPAGGGGGGGRGG